MMSRHLCVFCGSSPGAGEAYLAAAEAFGCAMVDRGWGLVFGGAGFGLMGRLADTVLARGGEAIGVMPSDLVEREVAHSTLSDLRIVDGMHERKALMAELSDGFVALPGGLGTLEEILEMVTWAQLGIHRKPCGLLNVDGYFDHLLAFIDHAVDRQFLDAGHRSLLLASDDPEQLLNLVHCWIRPDFDKATWIREVNASSHGGR